jgi:hypothetical protein
MKASILVSLAAFLAATACGGRHPTSELRIVEVHVPGAPVPIEGEFAYVRVSAADGYSVAERRLDGGRPLRLRVPPGRSTLSVWHRTCDGNCGFLDPPSDRCEATVALEAEEVLKVTIENTPGSPCRIVVASPGHA